MADLKFIVAETNKLINTDFNMISFDALPIANLVQILVDVLHDFGALSKVIINYEYNCFLVDEKKKFTCRMGRHHLWLVGEWCRWYIFAVVRM